jgi:hypothetical protein
VDSHAVFDEVERRLREADERLDFHAVEKGVHQDDDWWYVPVITQMTGGRPVAREFAIQILAKVEAEIFADKQLNVLLVPSQP